MERRLPDFTPAKRGFIAITERSSRGYSLIAGCYSTNEITVGIVESVTRDGAVKVVAPASPNLQKLTPRDWHHITLLNPERLADAEAFLAECKARQTTDPETYKPWADLNDVRETARKYLA